MSECTHRIFGNLASDTKHLHLHELLYIPNSIPFLYPLTADKSAHRW